MQNIRARDRTAGHNTAQNALIANMRDAPRNIQHSLGHGAG
jgi:hypothetical protein